MAIHRECPRIDEGDEPRIPVFTVVKNGAVLKNIFVVDKPPPSPDLADREPADHGADAEVAGREGRDEMLIVGRHPDCHIMLTHPSISRFHLQIRSDPLRRKLSVVDLSSVHGTWVSEKKIEPGVVADLSEGDTLRVGGSSRVYRLHWIPVSRAYDFENPFIPALDASSSADEEKEQEDLLIDKEKLEEDVDLLEIQCEDDDYLKSSFVLEDEEHVYQDCFHDENQGIYSPESLSKGVEVLALDDCEELPLKNHIPSQLLIPKNPCASTYGEQETDTGTGAKVVDNFFMAAQFLQTEPMNTSPFRISYDVENQKLNEEEWSTEVGNATGLESADEGSLRSVHDDLDDCIVAEASEESKFNLSIDSELGDSLSHPSAPYPHSICPEIFSEMEIQQLGQEDHAEQPFNILGSLSAEGKIGDSLRKDRKTSTTMFIDDAPPKKCCSSAVEIPEESQNQIIHVDNQKGGDNMSHRFAKSLIDAIPSSESDRGILLETTDKHLTNENQMPQYGSVTVRLSESDKESSPLRQSCTKWKCSSIWSRRGKPSTVLQLQTNSRKGKTKSAATAAGNKQHNRDNNKNELSRISLFGLDGEEEEIFTLDKENLTPEKKPSILLQLQTNKRKGLTKSAATASQKKQHNQDNNRNQLSGFPFFGLDGEEEEIFTPDKENLTPNTRLLKSSKKMSEMEVAEAKPLDSLERSSLKHSSVTNICNEEDVFYSDKENQTPEVPREQKMARHASGSSSRPRRELGLKQGAAERCASKSLNVWCGGQSTASGGATKRGLSVDGVQAMGREVSGLSPNNSDGEKNKSWIMVVDTTSFLDKESRKSLQLLQGLKGTQLVIPRIVIRELDCLKRRTSMFKRTTEVSSALKWIEDTMVNFKCWIHVQRSIEEGMSIAPTPPATPATPGESVMGIISPTTEDHILESAVFYRKTKPNGQLVLLSNDISLKIKAMAEGLLCETAQEFRESLVNPFSNRFMWADSSPRGQTWSCLDDMVLKEKYYSRRSKKPARGEGLSGLKLILLHNSHYGQQIRSVG